MNLVIGSGPSATACAHALLDSGEKVLLVDGGLHLDPAQEQLLSIAREGNAAAFERLKISQRNIPLSAKGVELKLAYGSDFAYRGAAKHLGFSVTGSGLLPSLARGGLSHVWGAAVMPYAQRDIPDWPITVADLAPHYEAVLKLTGLAASRDDLADAFPLYASQLNPLQPSSQAKRLLVGLARLKSSLRQDGITYGGSRLALGPNHAHQRACIYCGQCLYGCPIGVIYSTTPEIGMLTAKGGDAFAYQPDVIVEKIAGNPGALTVSGHDRVTGRPLQLDAARVFLGAGVIPSSRIMLKSLDAFDHPLTLRDSQYFILPLLAISAQNDVTAEALHTLSQVFLEIEDQAISPYTVHLQVYTYNDLIPRVLREKLWFAPGLRAPLIKFLERRLLVIQGYLHSTHSGTMSLRLTRDSAGREQLTLEGKPNPEAKKLIAKIAGKISPHLRKLGLFTLGPAVDITPPGRGFHSGGSFPMRDRPAAFESDRLGVVPGLPGVHLIDASVFPSIPATTITLTAMANAHRIGSTWRQRPA